MLVTLVQRYIKGLERDWNKHGTSITKMWVTKEGKLVSQSVDAFVDKNTGDVYKPASWNAPAKGVRYNLFDDIDYLENNCGSGHLYMK